MCVTNNNLVSTKQGANTSLKWHVVELTTNNDVLKKRDRKYSDVALKGWRRKKSCRISSSNYFAIKGVTKIPLQDFSVLRTRFV